jgi:hypothetical protein
MFSTSFGRIIDSMLSRFHSPFGFSCVIATTILKDKAVVESYAKKSRQLLSEQYSLATKVLDKAGIDYGRNG